MKFVRAEIYQNSETCRDRRFLDLLTWFSSTSSMEWWTVPFLLIIFHGGTVFSSRYLPQSPCPLSRSRTHHAYSHGWTTFSSVEIPRPRRSWIVASNTQRSFLMQQEISSGGSSSTRIMSESTPKILVTSQGQKCRHRYLANFCPRSNLTDLAIRVWSHNKLAADDLVWLSLGFGSALDFLISKYLRAGWSEARGRHSTFLLVCIDGRELWIFKGEGKPMSGAFRTRSFGLSVQQMIVMTHKGFFLQEFH